MAGKNIYTIAKEETYKDGDIIFNEGSSGDWVYVILSGSVEIYKTVGDQKFVVTVLQPDEVFGELGFVGGIKRTASARAIGTTTIGIIDREFLDKEFNQLSGQFRSLFEIITVRFKQMLERATDFTRRTEPRERAALSLNFKDRQSFVRAYSANVSKGGLFIKTENPLNQGEQFQLKLQLPGLNDTLQIKCDVIWSQKGAPSQPDKPSGMGVKFREMPKKDLQLLKEYLDTSE